VRFQSTKAHMRKMVAHKCSHSTQYTLTQIMQQNADRAMGREPQNCSPKPTQKLQRHADKIMGRESPEPGANNQSFEPPVASTTGRKKSKMSKKSSGSRGNRTPTTGIITDRAVTHERGCRGICPDLGESLLEEANHSFESRADTAANPMRQPMNKRKSRIIIDDGPDINTAATWVDAPATATIDGEIAAPTTTARATEPLTASKRIKLPDTNKRKAVCLEPTDVLQVKIGRHKGAAYIYLRELRRTTNGKRAMELQVAGRGGNKRKYALADIKADIANKCLFVRKPPPPLGGAPRPSPPARAGTSPPHPYPSSNTNGKRNKTTTATATATTATAPTTPTDTTARLLGRWLKTAEVRDREVKPD
jgi:hypothetical protein